MRHSPRLEYLAPRDLAAGRGMLLREVRIPEHGAPNSPAGGACFTVPKGERTPISCHAPREMWIIASGSGELTYDGERINVTAGDILLFGANREHSIFNNKSVEIVVFAIWWY